MNATKNLILHLTGSSPGLFPWEEEMVVVIGRTTGTSSCAQHFTRTVSSASPREAHVTVVPPDGEGDGSLGRRDPMADGWLLQHWNLVCLTPGPELRDPKHGWAMGELTCDLAKSATIGPTSCDPQGPVSTKPFQSPLGEEVCP